MVIPFMTLYLTDKSMNYSLKDAGIVTGLFGSGSIIGAYAGGKLTDKIGFRKVQLYALALGGLLFFLLGQLQTLCLIGACAFLLGAINEAFRPANLTAISYYSTGANRARSYSLNRLAVNLGWAVGASLAGLLAAINYKLLFWVDGISNLLAALVLYLWLKPPKDPDSTDGKEQTEQKARYRSAYKDKTYLWFIVLVTLFGLCFFQLFTTIPKYFRDNLRLSETFIGFVMALNGLMIVLLEMVLVYILEKKNKPLLFVSRGFLVCTLSFLVLALPGNGKLIALLMILLVSMGEIISFPFLSMFWTDRSTVYNRGQYAALYTIAWGFSQAIGPYICSMMVDVWGFQATFIVLAGVLLFCTLSFFRMHIVSKR